MHMADTLISPAVGTTLWAVSAAAVTRGSWRVKHRLDSSRVPLMGVLGAFLFAAQMINFSIPGTGSSGHLGGGLLLAILLGPDAALLAIASVLVVQALVFADGGLLALGCNAFNMGVLPAFVAYPLVYRPLARGGALRRSLAVLLAALVGLQLGAFAVVLETVLSGRTELPFRAFLLAMQPIHLAIGLVEGFVTLAILGFLQRARPEILDGESAPGSLRSAALVGLLALLLGGVLTWYASKRPDGLEWATHRVSGGQELNPPANPVHTALAKTQQRTALMPDYQLKGEESKRSTSLAGLVGGITTLALLVGVGFSLMALRRRGRRA